MLNLTGKQFGWLAVIAIAGTSRHGHRLWLCRCKCGKESTVRTSYLTTSHTTSCGCFNAESSRQRAITHGRYGTRTYKSWQCMIQRCTNPRNNRSSYYYAQGVTVCERWLKFENFLADMGERPIGKTLDRYPDNNGNYGPTNCRWATPQEQRRNRRDYTHRLYQESK